MKQIVLGMLMFAGVTSFASVARAVETPANGALHGVWYNGLFGNIIEEGLYTSINFSNYHGWSNVSARISGFVSACEGTGTYWLRVTSDDGSSLFVNHKLAYNDFASMHGPSTVGAGAFMFTANTWFPILIEHQQGGGGEVLLLEWSTPTNSSWHQITPACLGYNPLFSF